MLDTEWYSDDGNAAERSESKMKHCNLNTSDKDPDHVHDNGKTAPVIRIRHDITAERP
jgi:hypothetical protein